MKSFSEWVLLTEEAKKSSSPKKKTEKKSSSKEDINTTNKIHAVMDIAEKIQSVFKKYTLNTRKDAWKKLNTPKAKELFEKLLINPDRSLNTFRNIATEK
jgi:ribosomal protein L17